MEKYTLSGDMDQDMFLNENDLGESHWSILMGCYHQGQCENDAKDALEVFEIADYDKAFEYIKDSGLDEDDFYLQDEESEELELDTETVGIYYLWMLSGNIQDEVNE